MRIPGRGHKSNTALAVFLVLSIFIQAGFVGGLDYWWRTQGQYEAGARDYTASFYLYERLSFEARVDLKKMRKKDKKEKKPPTPPPKKRKIVKKARKVRKLRKKRRLIPEKPVLKEKPKPVKPKLKAFVVVEMDSGDTDVARVEAGDTNQDNPVASGSETKTLVKAVAEIDEVTRVPRLTRNISGSALMKHYPRRARLGGVEATVVLEILIDEKGRVEKTKVVRVKGVDDKNLRKAFRKAARAIVAGLRFKPAAQGDRVVAMWIPWTIEFVLAD